MVVLGSGGHGLEWPIRVGASRGDIIGTFARIALVWYSIEDSVPLWADVDDLAHSPPAGFVVEVLLSHLLSSPLIVAVNNSKPVHYFV